MCATLRCLDGFVRLKAIVLFLANWNGGLKRGCEEGLRLIGWLSCYGYQYIDIWLSLSDTHIRASTYRRLSFSVSVTDRNSLVVMVLYPSFVQFTSQCWLRHFSYLTLSTSDYLILHQCIIFFCYFNLMWDKKGISLSRLNVLHCRYWSTEYISVLFRYPRSWVNPSLYNVRPYRLLPWKEGV